MSKACYFRLPEGPRFEPTDPNYSLTIQIGLNSPSEVVIWVDGNACQSDKTAILHALSNREFNGHVRQCGLSGPFLVFDLGCSIVDAIQNVHNRFGRKLIDISETEVLKR